MSSLTFVSPDSFPPGTIASLLRSSYHDMPATAEERAYHRAQWRRIERLSLEDPDVSACVFLTCLGGQLVGFGSLDPQRNTGAVGQNAVHPDFRGLGYGRQQLIRILNLLKERGCSSASVKTGEHAFFAPAQRMYLSCGFVEYRRYWREEISSYRMVEFRFDLSEWNYSPG